MSIMFYMYFYYIKTCDKMAIAEPEKQKKLLFPE